MRYRRELLALERVAAADLLAAYAPAHQAIKVQLAAITAKIVEAQEAGQPLGRSWLFQQDRAASLELQIRRAMADFAPRATLIVRENQRSAVSRARANSRSMVVLAAPAAQEMRILSRWDALPQSAVESLVGFAANGSPLRNLFDDFGPQVSRAIVDELSTGLALGRNPRRVAARVNAKSGMGLARALTISRTEMLRSYREATRLDYERSGVVTGWVWLSARDSRTCAACWAMDGKKFKNDTEQEAHPNCRCTMVPDLGDTDIGSGAEVFKTLAPTAQRKVLGKSKFDAYQAGQISLDDLVVRRRSREWGASHQVGSLRQALKR